ncbi:MAG TPA: outer membrane protein assembly factor BamA [Taishania sp.]|nr:outer membrane protein assembly factor BamA [Taishania sp.]
MNLRLLLLLFFTGFIINVSISQIQIGGEEEVLVEDTTKITPTNNEAISVGMDYNNPKEYIIGPINVEGAEGYDPNAIRLVAGLRQGQKIVIPGQQIASAINNLWKEELFSDVQIYADKELAGVIYLTIKVAPRPKLSKYKFIGINKRQADKIREQINLFTGKTISENLVYQTRSKIMGYFREEGFYAAKVNIKRVPDEIMMNSEMFLIECNRGHKVKIKKINFYGNKTVKSGKLRRAMKDTKQRSIFRIFKASKFTESAYERDKIAMLNKFGEVGLRDARIVKDTFYMVDDRNLMIEIKIDEGEKYYFGDINWIGNTKFRSSYLDTILGIKSGDIYNKQLLDERLRMSQDGRDISSLYMDRGYLFFDVNAVETDFTDNKISYEIRIREGKEARVGTISIRGNTKTNDHVILREIRTRPGDLFSRNDIIRTQRELAQLGYFNEQAFQVNPMPDPQKGTVDIEYVVEEKSSDQIELSGGYGGRNYITDRPMIIGTLGLTFNNFSVKNMFKGEAWKPLPSGDGQRLSIRGQTNGRYYQSYNFSFTEPWLGGKKPNSLTFYLSHTALTNGRLKKHAEYQGIGITGVGLALGRRKKWPDDYFTESFDISYQYYDLFRYAQLFPDLQEGYSNDISFQYAIQRSSVSSPIYPTSGSTISLSAKSTLPYSLWEKNDYSTMTPQQRFKYLEYFKIKLGLEWFFPLTHDQKLVLRTRVGMGYMGMYNKAKGLSPFERYYLGGSGISGMNQIGGRDVIAVRGYDDNALSSSAGDPIAIKYTMELRYPISLNPSATFFVLAFAEAGNSFPSFKRFNPLDVKRSVGAGIRIFLPMFGMLGIDYGFGFDKLSPWATGYGQTSDQSIKQKGYYGKLTFTIGMNLGEL